MRHATLGKQRLENPLGTTAKITNKPFNIFTFTGQNSLLHVLVVFFSFLIVRVPLWRKIYSHVFALRESVSLFSSFFSKNHEKEWRLLFRWNDPSTRNQKFTDFVKHHSCCKQEAYWTVNGNIPQHYIQMESGLDQIFKTNVNNIFLHVLQCSFIYSIGLKNKHSPNLTV